MTRNFNLPPGVTLRDLDGGLDHDQQNRAYDDNVERAKDAWVMEQTEQKERLREKDILGTTDRHQ